MPEITADENELYLEVEVQNFAQVESKTANLKVKYIKDEMVVEAAAGKIPALKSYEKSMVELKCGNFFDKGAEYTFVAIINRDNKKPVILHGKVIR